MDLHKAVVADAARSFDDAFTSAAAAFSDTSFSDHDYLISVWTARAGDYTAVDNPACGFNGEAVHAACAQAFKRIVTETTGAERELARGLQVRCESMALARAFMKELVCVDQTTYASSYGSSGPKAPTMLPTILESPSRIVTMTGAALLLPILERYGDTVEWMVASHTRNCFDAPGLHPWMHDPECDPPLRAITEGRWSAEHESRAETLLALPAEHERLTDLLAANMTSRCPDVRPMGKALESYVMHASSAEYLLETQHYWIATAMLRRHFGMPAANDASL